MNQAIKTTTVRMFANFERKIFIPLVGELSEVKGLHDHLQAIGAAIGRHTVAALLEGKELIVRGFEVVNIKDHHLIENGVAKRSDMPNLIHVPKSAYVAAGEVLPVRHGSKIAIGLELLLKGATEEDLKTALGHDSVESVHSFLMARPKKRGYGIKKEGEKFFLVFPENRTEILYK